MTPDPHESPTSGSPPNPIGLREQPTAILPPPLSLASALPSRVGPYLIKRIIGEGGMGVVVEGEHERLGSRAALKLMRRTGGGASSSSAVARFIDESRFLAMLDHPAICRVLDAGTYEDPRGEVLPYFAMELVEGGRDIQRHCADAELSIRERVQLILPVLDAVEYGHQRGVLHRDLKPENILVGMPDGMSRASRGGETPRARLIDFGIAHAVGTEAVRSRLTVAGSFLGTPRFASPEQLSGNPRLVDQRTDVYALGVVLYELLLGVHPYGMGAVDVQTAGEAIRSAPALRSTQSGTSAERDLEVVLHTAVAREPAERYQSVAALAADLRRWLADEPVLARRPSWWMIGLRRARTTASLNRPLTRMLVVVAAMLFVMLPLGYLNDVSRYAQSAVASAMAPAWKSDASTEGVAVVLLTDSTKPETLGPVLGIGPVAATRDPTWRRMHGKLIEILAESGAQGVVMDMAFDAASLDPSCDRDLAASIDRAQSLGVPVSVGNFQWFIRTAPFLQDRVLAGGATFDQMPGMWVYHLAMSRAADGGGFHGTMNSLAMTGLAAARAPGASPVASLDESGEVVEIRYMRSKGGRVVEDSVRDIVPVQISTLDADDADLGLRSGDKEAIVLVAPWDDDAAARVTVEYADIARRDPRALEMIKGRVVVVARCDREVSADETTEHPTHGRPVWRVYAHASTIAALIQQRSVRLPGVLTEWGASGLVASLGVVAGVWPRRRRFKALAVFGVAAGILGVSVLAWWFAGVLVLPAQLLIGMVFAAIVSWWLAPRAVR
jgi:serine/threonine protein kinase/CHASE2 domain-containing sensor protein